MGAENLELAMNNVSVIYPDEDSGINRKLILRDDGEFLQIDIISENRESGGITLTKNQMKLLRDNLSTFINNKLIE